MQPPAPQLVFFDLETAGLDARRHPIIQIAAIAVDSNLQPLETFEAKVRFDAAKANRRSLHKNHYDRGTWAKQAVMPSDAAKRFSGFLRRHATTPRLAADGRDYFVTQLVAHHGEFDGPFLRHWYAKLGTYLPANGLVLCTMQRAMWWFGETPDAPRPRDFKLATLCRYFDVPFHAAEAHEALADVTATLALYRRLVAAELGGMRSKRGRRAFVAPTRDTGSVFGKCG